MNPRTAEKLREAEITLALRFPKRLFDFIRKLENEDVLFGQELWQFPVIKSSEDNFILKQSHAFEKKWCLKGLVFAVNTNNDYLFLMQDKEEKVRKEIFILVRDKQEVKIFNYSFDKLLLNGPLEYHGWEDYYLKLENGIAIAGNDKHAEDN